MQAASTGRTCCTMQKLETSSSRAAARPRNGLHASHSYSSAPPAAAPGPRQAHRLARAAAAAAAADGAAAQLVASTSTSAGVSSLSSYPNVGCCTHASAHSTPAMGPRRPHAAACSRLHGPHPDPHPHPTPTPQNKQLPPHAPPFRLARPQRGIAWHRWERSYLRLLEQKERQLALLSSGGDLDQWYYSMWDNPEAHQQLLEDQVCVGVVAGGWWPCWTALRYSWLAGGQCSRGRKIHRPNALTHAPQTHAHFHARVPPKVRYAAYQDALMAAAPLLEGKTVLDVGCGVGLLSMMAAEVGGGLTGWNGSIGRLSGWLVGQLAGRRALMQLDRNTN
jgi:hypothetical protein